MRNRQAFIKAAAPLVVVLALGGCGARDCSLDIAHRDCPAQSTSFSTFPQDDAICRSYGLTQGTRDYAKCRSVKRHERKLTTDESDYGFLRNPILPDLR